MHSVICLGANLRWLRTRRNSPSSPISRTCRTCPDCPMSQPPPRSIKPALCRGASTARAPAVDRGGGTHLALGVHPDQSEAGGQAVAIRRLAAWVLLSHPFSFLLSYSLQHGPFFLSDSDSLQPGSFFLVLCFSLLISFIYGAGLRPLLQIG